VTINAVALISTFGDILSAKDLTDLLTFLLAKLKAEIKRQQVMRALSRIPSKQLDFPENVRDFFREGIFHFTFLGGIVCSAGQIFGRIVYISSQARPNIKNPYTASHKNDP